MIYFHISSAPCSGEVRTKARPFRRDVAGISFAPTHQGQSMVSCVSVSYSEYSEIVAMGALRRVEIYFSKVLWTLGLSGQSQRCTRQGFGNEM